MASSSTLGVSPEDDYHIFVSETASKIDKFKVLHAFVTLSTKRALESNVHITVITFSNQEMPAKREITGSKLKELQRGVDHQLYIVENITPTVLTLLGGYCNVDPQFFLDYLDAILRTQHDSKESRANRTEVEPRPWYRLGDLEETLPVLRSIQSKMDHIHSRFIGPREYQPEDTKALPVELPDRIEPDLDKRSVERIVGGHNPIPHDGKSFYPCYEHRPRGLRRPWHTGCLLYLMALLSFFLPSLDLLS
jgi:hypothetical protein